MAEIKKVYARLGGCKASGTTRSKARAVACLALSFINLARAALAGGPGAGFHLAMAVRAVRLAGSKLSLSQVYSLVAAPMDSFRYFEFDFFWESVRARSSLGSYLDVSSPRLFNWRVLASGKTKRAVLSNPDRKDLALTIELLDAAALADHCEVRNAFVSELAGLTQSFDTVVCISVLEHIPYGDAPAALQTIWSLVKPGGRLLLSVPCAAGAFEEFTDFNEYGLLHADDGGFVFGQRFYDQKLLDEHIHAVVGAPSRSAIFGEKVAGTFFLNRQKKLSEPNYPFWKEAWYMATQYQHMDRVDDLPGLGVVAFEFVKA